MVIFGQNVCNWANWLYLAKTGCIYANWLYLGKMAAFGQRWCMPLNEMNKRKVTRV